ncbi:MAG: DUF362 domain-containing protein [Erysipelotrichaceae bacterium]|nr:DUF362 domain-containing protein [Erysipelotrichaceae bacterium]
MKRVKVYFTKEITSEGLIRVYEALNRELKGKIAIKISTGEPGGHNFLSPSLIQGLVQKLNGTIVECNTAYKGKRFTTEDHLQAARDHGFMEIADVDIMDCVGDMELPVEGGKHLQVNYVGKNLENYNSMLILSHFKGHAMGGYGGALKNMSIGVASTKGKTWIHSAARTTDPDELWGDLPSQDAFLESMAEADKAVMDYMKDNLLYINVMNRLSVDCDCDSNPEDPCMEDIGILASVDPVALDEACLDLIYHSTDLGRDHLVERIERQNGRYITEYAEKIGIGSREYELISIDKSF